MDIASLSRRIRTKATFRCLSLPRILERAVLASFAEVLSEECEVDFNENTLDSCSGEVTEALGRVVVYASAAEVAGRFSNNLRSKELERLRTGAVGVASEIGGGVR